MKLLRLAHVVLYSDSYMGHESSASKYRPVSKYRHCHRRRVYTGLTVTHRSSADVTVTVLVKDHHDFFEFVSRLIVFAFSWPVLFIRLEPNEENLWWLDNPGEGILYDSAASSNSRCR